MKTAVYILNFLLLAVMVALDVTLILSPSLMLKSLASVCFVLIGLVNIVYAAKNKAKMKFPVLMLIGFVLAMVGDIVIYDTAELSFIIGAALFAVAHVFYAAAFFVLYGFRPTDLMVTACVFVPSILFITLAPIFDFGGAIMEVVCAVYALILSCMVGKALSNLGMGTAISAVIAAGSILFFTSDLMLLLNMFGSIHILNMFGSIHKIPRILCLATYYPAQFLLAFSLVPFSEKGLNIFKRIYRRVFQTALKIALPFLPYKNPRIIDKVTQIPQALLENSKTHPLIVTDKTIRGLGLVAPLEEALKSAGVAYSVYDGAVANPTTANAEEALKIYKNEGCDSLIGFGGGSPIDCAKCVGALVVRPDKTLNKLSGILKVNKKIPLLIAVPTTAGTGSETTLAAVIVDSATHHKYAINDFSLIPSYAVLDEEVCATLPKHIIATTGMDALTHAVEAFIGRGGNASTRRDALDAVKLIFENLEKSYAGEREAAKQMLLASHKAGRAFSKAYVGNVHALAHPLGGKYNIPHGLANAVILPIVLREYGKSVHKKLYKIAVFCGLADKETGYARGAEIIIEKIETLNEKFGLGKSFAQIRRGDIEEMAAYAEKEANPLYPVPVMWSKEKFCEMYEKLRGENAESPN